MQYQAIEKRIRMVPAAVMEDSADAAGWDWIAEWAEVLETAGGRAVLALDPAGRVVVRSRGAAALFGGRLNLHDGRLVIADADAQAGLDALVAAALKDDPAKPGPLPPPLILRRASGRYLHIDVWPVPRPGGDGRLAVLLLLRETEGDAASRAEVLRARFGLTPAEVRLALAISDGAGLVSAAERLGIRVSTARAHLKSVFLKTETHRQAELVALLARLG
jgi:DNA-binding CsgD family transcriptional regulator